MEGRCLTQIELFGQKANYLKIQFRDKSSFFYLGAPQMLPLVEGDHFSHKNSR